jgi:ribosome-binding protein aMBF1 (putative translation factor)
MQPKEVIAMTILDTPIADAFIESPDDRRSTANARNSSKLSNICVGSRLRTKRTSHGISEQELSERLGIDRGDLDAYEVGAKRASANLLLRIAKLLDVGPDYFFRGYTKEELEGCLKLSLQ